MTRPTRDDWARLHIAKFNDWVIALVGDQHTLGTLIIHPPRNVEGSITEFSDEEIITFKKVAKIAEQILINAFQAEWFNYSQDGNKIKNLHIMLKPRYSSERKFEGYMFTDEGWGGPIKSRNPEELPDKEIVFKIVDRIKEEIKKMDIKDFNVEII